MTFRILSLATLAVAACSAETSGLAPAADARPAGWSIDAGSDLNAFFECLEAEGVTLVAAHRGGPADGYPENALATFERTLAAAPALLEVDVAASADGVLFLHHDDMLERTTTGEGRADETPWSTISGLRLEDDRGARTSYRPTRLSEALEWAKGRTLLELDFKRSAKYEDAIAEIRAAGMESGVILIAHTPAQARKLHALAPEMMISLNLASMSALNEAVTTGAPADRLLAFTGLEAPRETTFRSFNDRDVEVIFGTLGGADSIDREIAAAGSDERYADLAAQGIDILATDRPLEAHAALETAGRAAKDGACGVAKR